jgi:hypothetical protein
MPVFLPILLTGAHLALATGRIPALDVAPGCRAAAAAAVGEARDDHACRQDEHRARHKLKQSWDDYSAAQRRRCSSLARMGGAPSYVELLTCLEIAKAADKLPDAKTDGQPDDVLKP